MTILDYPCIAILGFHVFRRCVGSPTKIGKLNNEEQDGTVDSADSLPHNRGSEWSLCSESLFGRIMNLVSIFLRILLRSLCSGWTLLCLEGWRFFEWQLLTQKYHDFAAKDGTSNGSGFFFKPFEPIAWDPGYGSITRMDLGLGTMYKTYQDTIDSWEGMPPMFTGEMLPGH